MALPNSIDSTTPPDSQAPSLGDDRIRELKQALIDILGIPNATNVTTAFFTGGASGLTAITFVDAASSPNVEGRLSQANKRLMFHDGSVAQSLNGTIYLNTTAVGNVGSGTDDLMGGGGTPFTMPIGYFDETSRIVELFAFGTTAANGTAKTIKLAIGSTATTLNSVTPAPNNKLWCFHGFLWHPATADTQFCVGTFALDPGSTEPGVNISAANADSGSLTIKFTGAATSDDDITQLFMMARLVN